MTNKNVVLPPFSAREQADEIERLRAENSELRAEMQAKSDMLAASLRIQQSLERAFMSVDKITEIVRNHLNSVYICTRTWEAWSVGTMTKRDFISAEETMLADEIAAAIDAAMKEQK